MEEGKPIYLSTTVQGATISFLSLLVMALHLNVGNDLITAVVTTGFTFVGLVLTIYGRIKATAPLKVGNTLLK